MELAEDGSLSVPTSLQNFQKPQSLSELLAIKSLLRSQLMNALLVKLLTLRQCTGCHKALEKGPMSRNFKLVVKSGDSYRLDSCTCLAVVSILLG